jgi:hypothetical protein
MTCPACYPCYSWCVFMRVTSAERGISPAAVTAIPTHLRKYVILNISIAYTYHHQQYVPAILMRIFISPISTGVFCTLTPSAVFDYRFSCSSSGQETQVGLDQNFIFGSAEVKDSTEQYNLGHPSLGEHVPVFRTFANEHKKRNVGKLITHFLSNST